MTVLGVPGATRKMVTGITVIFHSVSPPFEEQWNDLNTFKWTSLGVYSSQYFMKNVKIVGMICFYHTIKAF